MRGDASMHETIKSDQTAPLTLLKRVEAWLFIALIALSAVIGGLYAPRAVQVEEQIHDGWIAWRTALQDRLTEVLPHRELAKATLGRFQVEVLGQGREGVLIGAEGVLYTNQDLPVFRKEALAQEGQTLAFLIEAAGKVEAAGGQVVFLLLPDKRRVLAETFPHRVPAWLTTRYQRLLTQMQAGGLEVVAALGRLQALGRDAFMRADTHWTLAGADASAQLLADHIRAFHPQFADSVPYVRDDEDLDVLLWEGDMRSFIPLPDAQLERAYPREEIAQPFVFPDSDDVSRANLVVMGTSYTGFQKGTVVDPWMFSDLLRAALGTDLSTCSDWGEDLEEPFNSYWSRVVQGDLPAPDLMIWEVPERFFGYQVPAGEVASSGSLFEKPTDVSCG